MVVGASVGTADGGGEIVGTLVGAGDGSAVVGIAVVGAGVGLCDGSGEGFSVGRGDGRGVCRGDDVRAWTEFHRIGVTPPPLARGASAGGGELIAWSRRRLVASHSARSGFAPGDVSPRSAW